MRKKIWGLQTQTDAHTYRHDDVDSGWSKQEKKLIDFPRFLIFLFLSSSCQIHADVELDNPLELGDIMPQNRKFYDKMRPPKYKGKNDASKRRPCSAFLVG